MARFAADKNRGERASDLLYFFIAMKLVLAGMLGFVCTLDRWHFGMMSGKPFMNGMRIQYGLIYSDFKPDCYDHWRQHIEQHGDPLGEIPPRRRLA